MIGSIERVWRQVGGRPLLPLLVLVIAARTPTDPNRKITGYGGVLPVPAPVAPATVSSVRPDAILEQQHRDQRAARGRVLYAAGRAPQSSASPAPAAPAPASQRVEVKPQCERRVVQGRTPAPAPNS